MICSYFYSLNSRILNNESFVFFFSFGLSNVFCIDIITTSPRKNSDDKKDKKKKKFHGSSRIISNVFRRGVEEVKYKRRPLCVRVPRLNAPSVVGLCASIVFLRFHKTQFNTFFFFLYSIKNARTERFKRFSRVYYVNKQDVSDSC